MESWRNTWRKGVAPLLSTESLDALRSALVNDDTRLLQGATCTPPPLQCVQDWPVEAACALAYCGVRELGGFSVNGTWATDECPVIPDRSVTRCAATVAEVEEGFARMCFEIDKAMGEPAACRWFLNWFDDTPRDEMRRELLVEVQRALAQRLSAEDGAASNDETAAA